MRYSAEDALEALYFAALGRSSDDVGRRAYLEMMENNPDGLMEAARSMRASDERLANKARAILSDHSQFGEFPKLLRRLMKTGTRHGIVVDVGARGRERSNSFDLLTQFDWRGLLVEANPALIKSIAEDFEGTDFHLVQCAVGTEEGVMPFYIGANDDVSSLLLDHAAGWGDVRGKVRVPVRRLGPLLVEHGIPQDFDVLSLDIEGLDVAVLNDLIERSAYRPRHIVIEASYSFKTRTLKDVRCSPRVCFEYDIVDQTEANLILERSR